MHPLPAPETMQGSRKPNSPGVKEDTGSRLLQVRSGKSELACPSAEERPMWGLPQVFCGICYRKLEDLSGADLLWVVVCYICFLGLRQDEAIGGTHSSSVRYFHQAPFSRPGPNQMQRAIPVRARVLSLRSANRSHTCEECIQSRVPRAAGREEGPQDLLSHLVASEHVLLTWKVV